MPQSNFLGDSGQMNSNGLYFVCFQIEILLLVIRILIGLMTFDVWLMLIVRSVDSEIIFDQIKSERLISAKSIEA